MKYNGDNVNNDSVTKYWVRSTQTHFCAFTRNLFIYSTAMNEYCKKKIFTNPVNFSLGKIVRIRVWCATLRTRNGQMIPVECTIKTRWSRYFSIKNFVFFGESGVG